MRRFSHALVLIALLAVGYPAVAAPRDRAAQGKIAEAMRVHFAQGEFARAEALLLGTHQACEDRCSPGVLATIWLYVGSVRGAGDGAPATVREAFDKALALDATNGPDPQYTNGPTLEVYRQARLGAGLQSDPTGAVSLAPDAPSAPSASAPAAPAQTAPAQEAPAPSIPTQAGPSQGASPQQWPFVFTASELADLRAAGATFGADEFDVAQRLRARGFSSQQYVKAFGAWSRLGSPLTDEIEDVASLQHLGIPLSEYQDYVPYRSPGQSGVTDYYNHRIGGRPQQIVGGVLMGLGALWVVSGAVVVAASDGLAESFSPSNDLYSDDLYSDPSYWRTIGFLNIASGVVAAGIGVPLLASGSARIRRWAPPGSLDSGSVTQMDRYRLEEDRPSASLSLRPWIGSDVKGAALNLRF